MYSGGTIALHWYGSLARACAARSASAEDVVSRSTLVVISVAASRVPLNCNLFAVRTLHVRRIFIANM